MRSASEARGTPPLRVGNDVGVDVGNDVGVKPPRPRAAGAKPAGLRSLLAKQHAPKARPSPATDRGRRGGVPGRPSRTNGCAVRPARRRGAGHSPLTAGHRRPVGTTSLGAIHVASTPGGGVPPDPPPQGRCERRRGPHTGNRPRSTGLAGRAGPGCRCPGYERIGVAGGGPGGPDGGPAGRPSRCWWRSATMPRATWCRSVAWLSRRPSRFSSPAGSWSRARATSASGA
jgi:hypothetical protein